MQLNNAHWTNWIENSVNRSLKLALLEYKNFTEDVEHSLDKIKGDTLVNGIDYNKIMGFGLNLMQELETTRITIKELFDKTLKTLGERLKEIIGGEDSLIEEIAQKAKQRNQLGLSLIADSAMDNLPIKVRVSQVLDHSFDCVQLLSHEASTIRPEHSKQSGPRLPMIQTGEKNQNPDDSISGISDINPLAQSMGTMFESSLVLSHSDSPVKQLLQKMKLNKCIQARTEDFDLAMADFKKKKEGKKQGLDQGVQVDGIITDKMRSSVWRTVTCDNCLQYPLTGVRFKCTRRGNFDLCEKCVLKTKHLEQTDMIVMVKR